MMKYKQIPRKTKDAESQVVRVKQGATKKNEMKNMQAFTLYIFVSLFIIGKPTRSGLMQISRVFSSFFSIENLKICLFTSQHFILFLSYLMYFVLHSNAARSVPYAP